MNHSSKLSPTNALQILGDDEVELVVGGRGHCRGHRKHRGHHQGGGHNRQNNQGGQGQQQQPQEPAQPALVNPFGSFGLGPRLF